MFSNPDLLQIYHVCPAFTSIKQNVNQVDGSQKNTFFCLSCVLLTNTHLPTWRAYARARRRSCSPCRCAGIDRANDSCCRKMKTKRSFTMKRHATAWESQNVSNWRLRIYRIWKHNQRWSLFLLSLLYTAYVTYVLYVHIHPMQTIPQTFSRFTESVKFDLTIY